jgi:MFS transporter, FHS family, glucose/mannose:H+ symporter
MEHWRIKLSLFLNYFVFAILLNSVGTVILQVQSNFGITESAASVLEAFKDLSIAITSFLIASYIVRIGYKRAMLFALGFLVAACLTMTQVPTFFMTKLLFAATGVGFALVKVSVFATIGLVTKDEKGHVSFMNFLESFFMVGILSGYFLFSAFVDDDNPQSTAWISVYYLLAGLAALAFLLLWSTRLDETRVEHDDRKNLADDFLGMLNLIGKPLVLIFILSAFLYVLIEQGIMSWLPTFNSKILNLSNSLSIQMASILAGSFAVGRFIGGFTLKKYDWFKVLAIHLVGAAVLVALVMPLAKQAAGAEKIASWLQAPLAAFVFPLIGILLAPVYPAINSVVLSSLPVKQHAPMSGLIVVFSALGGTTGSMITGYLFEHLDGQQAFSLSIVPITAILVVLYFFKKAVQRASETS